MAYLELEDFEKEGRRLRRLLQVDDQAQPDVMTVIVKLKHLGLINNYERVPDIELPEDEALWDPSQKLLRIRESIYCAANQMISHPRARWTVIHEIGHMWRGHDKIRHRNVSGRLIEKIAAPIKRDEREAHGIAAAFLSPAHLVDDPLVATTESLAVQFNISLRAARIRKEELERMYRRANGILRPLPPSIESYLRARKPKQ